MSEELKYKEKYDNDNNAYSGTYSKKTVNLPVTVSVLVSCTDGLMPSLMLQVYCPVSSSTAADISSELSDGTRCRADEGRTIDMVGDENGEKVHVIVTLVRVDTEEEQVS